jgi:hypothetical protein
VRQNEAEGKKDGIIQERLGDHQNKRQDTPLSVFPTIDDRISPGRAIAVAFGRAGHRIGLIARGVEGLQSAQHEIERHGGTALAAVGAFMWGGIAMLPEDHFVWPTLVGS